MVSQPVFTFDASVAAAQDQRESLYIDPADLALGSSLVSLPNAASTTSPGGSASAHAPLPNMFPDSSGSYQYLPDSATHLPSSTTSSFLDPGQQPTPAPSFDQTSGLQLTGSDRIHSPMEVNSTSHDLNSVYSGGHWGGNTLADPSALPLYYSTGTESGEAAWMTSPQEAWAQYVGAESFDTVAVYGLYTH
ncbi:Uu.00g028350.m01.CDS01 [Anthostomella pinea]|uniref:Uu.00g028350.m01.CDS01 n=1 Tax=Anthostomella pinea TaxID=933095 RepID=A0AAI8YCT0_9PEZI|nr:Uu.00g028350.m01.CDS01 [Anthostomella pinea]